MAKITGLSISLLYVINVVVLTAERLPYEPMEVVFDCGGSTSNILSYGQKSSLLNSSKFENKKLEKASVSRTSIEVPMEPNVPNVCIFQNQTSFTFQVSPGMKSVRLHFYLSSLSKSNISNALFVVTAGPYTLLSSSNSSYLKTSSDIDHTIIKEFCVDVNTPLLNITFTPSKSFSPQAYGFVNKIEVLTMPSNLYTQKYVVFPSNFSIGKSTALEMMYRFNVGGPVVPAEEDRGMLRTWFNDEPYLVPDPSSTFTVHSEIDIKFRLPLETSYSGPLKVYATARAMVPNPFFDLSWAFSLEPEFSYLVRLHFCEITMDVTHENQRNFRVHINNQTVEDHADVIRWSGGPGVPVYRDYIFNFSRAHKKEIQQLLVLHLESKIELTNIKNGTTLNGLEIFKLSDYNNNFAGRMSPFHSRNPTNYGSSKNYSKVFLNVTFGILCGLVLLCLLFFILVHFRTKWFLCSVLPMISFFKSETRHKTFMERTSADHYCRYFSLLEIKMGTNNFSKSNLIGDGGFGKVYKGYIDKGATTVAIKRSSPTSRQGLHEFLTEITMLSKLRNRHIVTLIGHCMDDNEMILVYDFIARGALSDHLYNTTPQKTPLPWKLRLEICISAARGLHYLHSGTKDTIIHRDVKTTNILLDEKWVAKVADFGLSKLGPNMSHGHTHVSTLVKGSFGYLDPEYYRRQKLTEKSDVYSFGVVLFEVLCGRPAVLPQSVETDMEDLHQVNLAEWVRHCHQSGSIDQVVDQQLRGKIDPKCFEIFTEIARKCLADKGSERPSMNEVVWNLELARQQQEAADHAKEGCLNDDDGTQNFDGAYYAVCVGNSDATPGAEFTDIIFPVGR